MDQNPDPYQIKRYQGTVGSGKVASRIWIRKTDRNFIISFLLKEAVWKNHFRMYGTVTGSTDLKSEAFEKNFHLMAQSQEKCAGQRQTWGGLEKEGKNKYRTKNTKNSFSLQGENEKR